MEPNITSFIYESPRHQDEKGHDHGMMPPSPPARRNQNARLTDNIPTTLTQVLRPNEDGFFLVAPDELRLSMPSRLFCPRPRRPLVVNPPSSGHAASGTNMTTDIAPDAAIVSPVERSFDRCPLEEPRERSDCIHSESLFIPVDVTMETVTEDSSYDARRRSYPPFPRLRIQPRESRGSLEALLRREL